MRKNSSKLTLALLVLLAVSVLAVFLQHGLRDRLYLDGEYKGGYALTYQIDSTDVATVKSTAEVLEKRFYNAGATDVVTSIDGSAVTLKVSGIEDFTALRGLVTKPGKLTFRNTADEELMDASVLDARQPVTVTTSNDLVYVNLNVKDGTTFAEKTGELAASSDKMMVLWVDFEEGTDSYTAESAKEVPSFLGAATVTEKISASCYITTHQTYENARNMAIIVASGALPAGATETSFEAFAPSAGENAVNTSWMIMWCGVIVTAAVMTVLYGVPGLVSGICSIGFVAAVVRFAHMAGAVFNSSMVAVMAIMLASALYTTCLIYDKFREELLKGRNLNASVKTAYDQYKAQLWESPILMAITSGVAYLLFTDTLGKTAIICGISAAIIFVLFTLVNKAVVLSIIDSNIVTNKERYGVKVSDIPDVEKGETYKPAERNLSASLVKAISGNTLMYGIIAVSVCWTVLLGFAVKGRAVGHLAVIALIGVVIAEIYSRIIYRRQKPGYFLLAVLACCGLAAGCAFVAGGDKGVPLAVIVASIGILDFMLVDIRAAVRQLSRERINEDKLIRFVSELLNGFSGRALRVSLFVALMTATRIPALAMVIVLVCVTIMATALTAVSLACRELISNTSKGPKKKAKKTTGLKENTIFGINEMK